MTVRNLKLAIFALLVLEVLMLSGVIPDGLNHRSPSYASRFIND